MKNIFSFVSLLVILLQLSAYSQVNDINDWINLKKYAKSNESLGKPAAGEKRVVFMGNSITESWAVLDSGFFKDNGYIDRGISGQTSSQMLLRFRHDVIDLQPVVVVILAGTNDIAENAGPIALKDILGNIISMAQLAQANNIKVIICSVLPAYDFPWRHGLQPAEKIIKLNSMIKSYCSENKIRYVDYYSNMVDERKGLDKKYTIDGVHPTYDGYKVMDKLIKEAIKENLTSDNYPHEKKTEKVMNEEKKVTGVGGIFFKAKDPERLKEWYSKNLGLKTNEYGATFESRSVDSPEEITYLQWSPFKEETKYFEPSTKEFMINYRVENIEDLVKELKMNGVTVVDSIETYDYGKFVHILDPENNKIELWEPAGK